MCMLWLFLTECILRYSLLFMFICVLTMYHSHFRFLFFYPEALWFLFFVTIVPFMILHTCFLIVH